MIRILLSDDNESFRQSSREIGAALGFDVATFDDWENAQVELDTNFDQYHAVIIDGKGRLRDSAKAEDTKHLIEAIGWFREQRAKKRFIPVVVYTGFHPEIDSLTNTSDQVLKVFDKSKTKYEDVLQFLRTEIARLPEQKFRTAFPSVYLFSEKHFSNINKKLVREVYDLTGRKSDDFIWKKNSLNALRRLNEALVDTIPSCYYSSPFNTREYIDKIKRESTINVNSGNRSVKFIDFFHNNVLKVPNPISYTIKNIYDSASTYASHNDESQSNYYPSTEMIIGLVYSHFGCYHWFNQIIKD
ncbi:MAG: response regulator [Cyclobacteriaceae bacterium]|jgi:CheY-like chemotaxis protein|nr:response regulator [Cytophagales bacterium]MCZ8327802.1 response regulator [Cyclobacteriaceae bacterium]